MSYSNDKWKNKEPKEKNASIFGSMVAFFGSGALLTSIVMGSTLPLVCIGLAVLTIAVVYSGLDEGDKQRNKRQEYRRD